MNKGQVAVIVESGKPLEVREYELPKAESNALLLKTIVSGVCGTDVHGWRAKGRVPVIPGHEVIGTITDLGDNLQTDSRGSPVHVGDRILLSFARSCGKCSFCLKGQFTLCSNRTFIQNYRPFAQSPYFLGGYAEYVYAPPGSEFVKLPDDLPPEVASVFACSGPTLTHGFESVPIHPDETIVVQGSGPMGLFAVLYARESGASTIINVGAPAKRLEMAKALGATHTLDIEKVTDKEEPVKLAKKLTEGAGADVVIECTGVPSVVQTGMQMLKDGGRYLVIGCYVDRGPVMMNPHYITFRELKLFGSNGYSPAQMHAYLRFVNNVKNRYPISKLLTHKFSLAEATKALQTVEKAESMKAAFVFT
jgi:threonine dehydrogenase-like Zn-dependent dehydrogenase